MADILGIGNEALAVIIMGLAYMIIFSEKANRAVVALLGAGIMVFAGILTQDEAIAGIDFNTLALLIGMMIIVGICGKTGLFEFLAVWAAKLVQVNPRKFLAVIAVVTAVFSAFLDNVTTVLLIVPIIFKITKALKVTPYPYLLAAIFASNIGGTATLIGDPPNILIGSALHLSFMDFIYNLTPVVLIVMTVNIAIFDLVWGRKLKTTDTCRRKIRAIRETELITDYALLWKALSILALVILGFIFSQYIYLTNGLIALCGAAVLLMMYTFGDNHHTRDHKIEGAFDTVDWTTMFFFVGLFIIVAGVEKTGFLHTLGAKFVESTQYNIKYTTLSLMWVSGIFSAILDNIPFVATMIPTLQSVKDSLGGDEAMMPVWWALSLGACFGGNGTLIGASANVIVAGLAAKNQHPIGFIRYMAAGIPLMLLSIAIAGIYIRLRYL